MKNPVYDTIIKYLMKFLNNEFFMVSVYFSKYTNKNPKVQLFICIKKQKPWQNKQ